MLDTYEKHSRAKLVATLVTVLVIAGVVVLADHLKSQSTAATARTNTASSAAMPAVTSTATGGTASTSTSNSGGYKDGSYSAASDYFVPHSSENIQVTLTLQNGEVTNASIQNSESDPTSAAFQEDFAAEYKHYVVGKKISGLQLSTIAGASDTTQAFNDAVNQIASKAQS